MKNPIVFWSFDFCKCYVAVLGADLMNFFELFLITYIHEYFRAYCNLAVSFFAMFNVAEFQKWI